MDRGDNSPMDFVRCRVVHLGLSIAELCRQAGISRQTLYRLDLAPAILPTMDTVVRVAKVLRMTAGDLLDVLLTAVPHTKTPSHRPLPGDGGSFVGDITMPDGILVQQGQHFRKVWAVRNTGSLCWKGRSYRCIDDDILVTDRLSGHSLGIAQRLTPVAERIDLPLVGPGQIVEVAMDFVAPRLPCTVVSYWRLMDADGAWCFPQQSGLFVKVKVASGPASASAQQAPGDGLDAVLL